MDDDLAPFKLTIATGELEWNGPAIRLTLYEAMMLGLLANWPDRVVSLETLAENIWRTTRPADWETCLRVFAHHIRKKLKAAGAPDVIQTVQAEGYKLRGRITVNWAEAV